MPIPSLNERGDFFCSTIGYYKENVGPLSLSADIFHHTKYTSVLLLK